MDWFSIPSALTFVGAILVAAGTLWGAARQSAKSDEIAVLNRDLAAKSDEITRLTKDNLGAVTGGDSYCYLYVVEAERMGEQGPHTLAVHVGKHPLYDLEIRLVTSRTPDYWSMLPPDLAARLGPGHSGNSKHRNMRPGTAEWSFSVRPIRDAEDPQRFTFSFTARNGSWTQNMTLRKVGAEWKAASRVVGDSATGESLLREEVEPGFPVDRDGQPQW